jgi:hypothetical protein
VKAEAAGPGKGARDPASPAGGFDEALRRAADRSAAASGGAARRRAPASGLEPGTPPSSGAAPVDSGAAPRPARGADEAAPAASPSPAAAAAAVVSLALAAYRAGERSRVEIAVGAGLTYSVAVGNRGVELEARAARGLEGAARADLHAAGEWLRRGGVRVARAVVLRERPDGTAPRALTPPRRRR